jgi:hypothetical protein
MELKSTPEAELEIIVKKTTIMVNPVRVRPSARIIILNTPLAHSTYQGSQDGQLVISGPGEYEVEGIMITAPPDISAKGEREHDGFCCSIQNGEQSILVLPSINPVSDVIIEQLGFVDVLCVPVESDTADAGKALAALLKGFSDIKQLVLISKGAIDPKALEDVSTTIHSPTSLLKVKDLVQNTSERIEVYLLSL